VCHVKYPQNSKCRYGVGARDKRFKMLLKLTSALIVRLRTTSTHHLCKYPLQKHLHNSSWIGEDGADNLSFLADCDSNFLQQRCHPRFRGGRRFVGRPYRRPACCQLQFCSPV